MKRCLSSLKTIIMILILLVVLSDTIHQYIYCHYLHSPLCLLQLHGIVTVPSILYYSSEQQYEHIPRETKYNCHHIFIITININIIIIIIIITVIIINNNYYFYHYYYYYYFYYYYYLLFLL